MKYNMREAVDAGFALLDEKYGRRWVDGISLAELYLQSPCKCIIGQKLGHFCRVVELIKYDIPYVIPPMTPMYGFCIPHDDWDRCRCRFRFYPALTAMWKRKILERRLELELESIPAEKETLCETATPSP